ncbi:hypothetical protein FOA43_001498 [Brettanomyces nanus]|uniref:TFIIS N-terminal domain-containing protein n=1 Tax=Eeniella nana TaxID=13502 RepID=A0A875S4K3_EENNA|nr:uncharacterized protein FOA43_001498 [Brettanomyces nanus]QPG74174.1 hypothetical protein FOA43_001498 [Brettanomyces nanus]
MSDQEEKTQPEENQEVVKKEESVLVESSADLEDDVAKLTKHKRTHSESGDGVVKKAETINTKGTDEQSGIEEDVVDVNVEADDYADDKEKKQEAFERKFAAIMKNPKKRKKNNDVDLEAMQDEAISDLKNMMKEAAYEDIECVNNKKPATNKLKLLPKVKQTLLKSNLYDSILDNNLLEAVRIWMEPLPDASLPSYEIQKTLLKELTKLPIKTIHLRESGLGKVMIFYQKSAKVDPTLKRTADKLISNWTRPIMGRSDNYRAKTVPSASFNPEKFRAEQRLHSGADTVKKLQKKSLYQESADRRKRAAAPEARASVYTIAPQVSSEAFHGHHKSNVAAMGIGSSLSRDERFKRLNQKLTHMSQKKGNSKKGGVSIEGKGVNTF